MINIAVLGSGAIGTLISALLVDHQASVGQSNYRHQAAIRLITKEPSAKVHTFSLKSLQGEVKSYSIERANEPFLQHCDLLICCVKSYDVVSALRPLMALLSDRCHIVLCHNGMGTLEAINRELKLIQPVYALLTTMAAKRIDRNYTQHTGLGINNLGHLQGATRQPYPSSAVLDALINALPNTTYCDDIGLKQWQKLAINCAINPLTAIDDICNGKLASAKYQSAIKQCLSEVVCVANRWQINLQLNDLITLVNQVIEQTALNSSSMREDVRHNRRTEIDYITGYICEAGRNAGISTPVNNDLYRRVKVLEPH
ncbi:2-dehydropantoate 2-reductase [Thalassotalea ponticola]|uniref:ketopantoate reductase family protein n=1 Tax=Thalassotalea ponticola TaxID=1523392 RepID=UPI0025B356CC|nr:2-dehydropantoate 2-reductase [Thalassotalea ponticola]MDN3653147.1 2-dehydropantoate 2-reductase [Thalassotalea ponticola]